MADTYNARAVARDASIMIGRKVTDKQVRGLARGDSQPAVIARLDDEGWSVHAYSAAERTALLTAFAKRESKRTGKSVKVPAPHGPAMVTRSMERAAAVKATVKRATVKRPPRVKSVPAETPSETETPSES